MSARLAVVPVKLRDRGATLWAVAEDTGDAVRRADMIGAVLPARVRDAFLTLYNACGGPEAEQHSDWYPGIIRPVEACPAIERDPVVRAAYHYLEGVADALGLGPLGMLYAVLGESW